ncbi:MAG: substrate-binding domain-containing protein [Lentisphaeria bacterium]|nr:substrate-binding domain-containing protein [Lentisphaeria bacterium]
MKNKGRRAQKIRRVTSYLLNTLLPLSDGAELPAIREIMKKTNAGQLVVYQVLQSLQKQGLVQLQYHHRIRRRIEQVAHPEEIRLLHSSQKSGTEQHFIPQLFRKLTACAEISGRKLTVECFGDRQPEEVAEELTSQGVSSCIICCAKIPDYALRLKERMKVCLELLPLHSNRVTVELRDSAEMTEVQMTYLFNHGYRRIGYLHYGGKDMFRYPIQMQRLMDYYRLMAENGFRINPEWVFHCSENCDNIDVGMKQIMNSSPRPEALIVPGLLLEGVYTFCRKHKIRIGKDIGLFGYDDLHQELVPEPTLVCNDPLEIADNCWQMFQALERGEKVEDRQTQLLIRTGATLPSKM